MGISKQALEVIPHTINAASIIIRYKHASIRVYSKCIDTSPGTVTLCLHRRSHVKTGAMSFQILPSTRTLLTLQNILFGLFDELL